MWPYCARSPHGLATAADDAAAEDGPDAANRRPDANTAAARITAPAMNMSDLFMTSPLIIDTPIVLAARRSSHGRQIGDQWNFQRAAHLPAVSPAGLCYRGATLDCR